MKRSKWKLWFKSMWRGAVLILGGPMDGTWRKVPRVKLLGTWDCFYILVNTDTQDFRESTSITRMPDDEAWRGTYRLDTQKELAYTWEPYDDQSVKQIHEFYDLYYELFFFRNACSDRS